MSKASPGQGFPLPGQLGGPAGLSLDLDVTRLAAALVSAAVIIAGLYYGRDILIPLAVAFLITFALNVPVTWLVRRGLLERRFERGVSRFGYSLADVSWRGPAG